MNKGATIPEEKIYDRVFVCVYLDFTSTEKGHSTHRSHCILIIIGDLITLTSLYCIMALAFLLVCLCSSVIFNFLISTYRLPQACTCNLMCVKYIDMILQYQLNVRKMCV